jgi:hypothetical protein
MLWVRSDKLNCTQLKLVIQEIIKHSAPRGYDYEVAWSLWYAISFSIKIDDEIAKILSQINDSISILMVLHAVDIGLINKSTLDIHAWAVSITADSLNDDRWILSYEISVKKWLLNDFSYVDKNSFFSVLKKEKISFYEPSLQIDRVNNFNNPEKKIIKSSFIAPMGGY